MDIPEELVSRTANGDTLLFIGDRLNPATDSRMAEDMIAEQLAADLGNAETASRTFAELAEFYELRHNRPALVDCIREVLDRQSTEADDAHRLIAKLTQFKVLVTTALDRQLERAFDQVGRGYNVIVGKVDTTFDYEKDARIYKLRGSIDQPASLILSETDLDRFFNTPGNLLDTLRPAFNSKTILLIGYDLNDRYFKRLYEQVIASMGEFARLAYACGSPTSPDLRLWYERRHITVLPSDSTTFLQALTKRLAQRARAARPQRPQLPLIAEHRPPARPAALYKQLYYYDEADAPMFFGRDQDIRSLMELIQTRKLTLLFGASGVGKTSLLRAGVLPRLAASDPSYVTMYLRALNDPLQAIRTELQLRLPPGTLPESARIVDQIAAAVAAFGKPLIIAFDQFEEFFIQRLDADLRASSSAALGELVRSNIPVRLVLSLREDWLPEIYELQRDIQEVFHNQVRLHPLMKQQAHEAIIAPAQAVGVSYEPALLDQLLKDLTATTDHLEDDTPARTIPEDPDGRIDPPQLQLVCSKLYTALLNDEDTITLAMYERLGRVRGVLGDYLKQTLAQLGNDRDLARQALIELTTSRGTKAVKSVAALAPALGVDAAKAEILLERLVLARLVREVDQDGRSYELSHEYLIRELELSDDDRKRKDAEETIRGRFDTWQRYGAKALIDLTTFELVRDQRAAVWLPPEQVAFMLRGAISHSMDVEDWTRRLDASTAQALLLNLLLNETIIAEERVNTLQALAVVRPQNYADLLYTELNTSQEPKVLQKVLELLCDLPTGTVVPGLVELWSADDEERLSRITFALVALDRREATDELARLFKLLPADGRLRVIKAINQPPRTLYYAGRGWAGTRSEYDRIINDPRSYSRRGQVAVRDEWSKDINEPPQRSDPRDIQRLLVHAAVLDESEMVRMEASYSLTITESAAVRLVFELAIPLPEHYTDYLDRQSGPCPRTLRPMELVRWFGRRIVAELKTVSSAEELSHNRALQLIRRFSNDADDELLKLLEPELRERPHGWECAAGLLGLQPLLAGLLLIVLWIVRGIAGALPLIGSQIETLAAWLAGPFMQLVFFIIPMVSLIILYLNRRLLTIAGAIPRIASWGHLTTLPNWPSYIWAQTHLLVIYIVAALAYQVWQFSYNPIAWLMLPLFLIFGLYYLLLAGSALLAYKGLLPSSENSGDASSLCRNDWSWLLAGPGTSIRWHTARAQMLALRQEDLTESLVRMSEDDRCPQLVAVPLLGLTWLRRWDMNRQDKEELSDALRRLARGTSATAIDNSGLPAELPVVNGLQQRVLRLAEQLERKAASERRREERERERRRRRAIPRQRSCLSRAVGALIWFVVLGGIAAAVLYLIANSRTSSLIKWEVQLKGNRDVLWIKGAPGLYEVAIDSPGESTSAQRAEEFSSFSDYTCIPKVCIVLGEQGLGIRNDGGEIRWLTLPADASSSIQSFWVAEQGGEGWHLWALTSKRLLMSTDKGTSWQEPSQFRGAVVTQLRPLDSRRSLVIVAGPPAPALPELQQISQYLSSDGGISWQGFPNTVAEVEWEIIDQQGDEMAALTRTLGNTRDLVGFVSPDQSVQLAQALQVDDLTIWRSTDKSNWQQLLTIDQRPGMPACGASFSYLQTTSGGAPALLYFNYALLSGEQGIFVSRDQGATWTKIVVTAGSWDWDWFHYLHTTCGINWTQLRQQFLSIPQL
jgi:hypothetical protein